MECNKDEAIRAKDIAERKFTERDYAGAKKFALKAQALYPGLDGISQMVTTVDVYIFAQNKINGEMDMYGILGVNPLADDETIKKHYRKLVLQLHPDKNKSIGADGAFQLVSEAFNFLSDKAKRSAYNSRRNVRATQQKVPSKPGVPAGFKQSQQKVPTQSGVNQKFPTQSGVSQQKAPQQSAHSAVPPVVNGNHKTQSNTSHKKAPKSCSTRKASGASQGVFKRDDTFWTVCTRCKLQYEYVRFYLNQTLKCQHCQVGFVAVEIPPPSNLAPIGPQVQKQQQKASYSSGSHNYGFSNSFSGAGARWSPLSGTTSYNSNTASSASVSGPCQTTSVRQVVNEKVKREREEVQPAARWERSNDIGFFSGEGPSKRRKEDDGLMKKSGGSIPSQTGMGNREAGKTQVNPEVEKANFLREISLRYNVHRELSLVEVRKMLSGKALAEIRKKLKEWSAAKQKEKVKEKERQKSKVAKKVLESSGTKNESHTEKPSLSTSDSGTEQETPEMNVPDPDFHVFDSDRMPSCFQENQVWATYDDDDGMPRIYVLIRDVISLNPLKLRISSLNSKSNSEFGPLDWIGRGFRKTCGEFRIGKYGTNNLLNSFSQKVNFVKAGGVVKIYPQKGDIWALYRNWSPDWNEDTPAETVHAYDMVEVLDDYSEEQGLSVAPLIKAAGFRTVFLKHPDSKEVKRIPKEEMFRFSHKVPSHLLTGKEKPNAPKGYVELDPAATPSELLQVIDKDNGEKVN